MQKIIISPNYIETGNFPIIFLAGPIKGGGNWRQNAVNLLTKNLDIFIADPNSNNNEVEKKIDWETYYLNKASENGIILFWLPKINKEEFDGDCYAQTSRFELGEWKEKCMRNNKINLILGIEDEFSNSKYIKRRFQQDCPHIQIYNSLEKCCEKMIEIYKNKENLEAEDCGNFVILRKKSIEKLYN